MREAKFSISPSSILLTPAHRGLGCVLEAPDCQNCSLETGTTFASETDNV